MRALTEFARTHQQEVAITELADALIAAGLLPTDHPGLDIVRQLVAAVKSGRLRDPSMPPDPFPRSKYHNPGPPNPGPHLPHEDDMVVAGPLEPR